MELISKSYNGNLYHLLISERGEVDIIGEEELGPPVIARAKTRLINVRFLRHLRLARKRIKLIQFLSPLSFSLSPLLKQISIAYMHIKKPVV